MKRAAVLAVLALAGALPAPARAEAPSPLERALADELARARTLQLDGAQPPYYVAYDVAETAAVNLVASLGSLELEQQGQGRMITITVRVGEPGFDNGNFADGASITRAQLPLDDDYLTLRRAVWLATDRAYKSAAATLEQKRAALAGQPAPPEAAGDFSVEPPTRVVAPAPPPVIDAAPFAALARALSAELRGRPAIKEAYAAVAVEVVRRTFVSTEGSLVVGSRVFVALDVMGAAQADDGMLVTDYRSWRADALTGLPAQATLLAETRRLADELEALRVAPLVDAYAGPVLFAGGAGPELVGDVLALDFSGTPAPRSGESGGRSLPLGRLAEKVGQRILPAGFRVEDDPGRAEIGGVALVGGYGADEEGVPGQRVVLVEDGVLKDLLMARTPRAGHPRSNGHGRVTWGGPLACPSNLVVTAKTSVAAKELERRLLGAAKAAGLDHALVIERMGKPVVMRYLADGFAAATESLMRGGEDAVPPPVVVYKVGQDGKRTLVRGAVLGPIPTRDLKRIVAASRELYVDAAPDFGMAALRGGPALVGMRAAIAAPALILDDVAVERAKGGQDKPTIVPPPTEK